MSTTVPLFSRELGGAGKPPLVILHGLLGSSRNWQTAGRDLSERWNVFALDLRNHGHSPHAGAMSYEAMVEDVLAWMEAQKIERATVMGHSMGGKAAMLFACRRAERVERLIVVDIAPKDYRWAAHRAEFAAMNELDLAHLTSRAEAELKFEGRVDDWAMRKFLTTNLTQDATGKWKWAVNLPALTRALPELEKNPLEAVSDRFERDVLFVTGGKSPYVNLEEGGDEEAIRAFFPRARIETIAESGHNPHMEAREVFGRTVLAWANRASGA